MLVGGTPHRFLFHDLMDLFIRHAMPGEVLAVLDRLKTSGPPPNAHSYGYAIAALKQPFLVRGALPAESGRAAAALYDEMCSRGLHAADAVSHGMVANDAIDCLGKAGLVDDALALYHRSLGRGMRPSPYTFSALLKGCALAKSPALALDVVHRLMPAAGVAPSTATWNGLLGVFAAVRDVDSVYAVWTSMAELGVVPDVHTERLLAQAFASHPQLAAELLSEARQLQAPGGGPTRRRGEGGSPAAEPRASGATGGPSSAQQQQQRLEQRWRPPAGPSAAPSRQQHVKLDMLVGGASSAASLGLTLGPSREEAGGGGRPGGKGGGEAGSDPRSAPADGSGAARLEGLLLLDLHGHSQPAARMTLLRRLEVLVERWPAVQEAARWAAPTTPGAPAPAAAGQQRRGGGEGAWGEGPALCIITGTGRHRAPGGQGQGVLKEAVRSLLEQQGLPARNAPGNPGRLLVAWADLAPFLARKREGMQRARLLSVARARYLWVGAGVAGLAGAALIVPRLAPWM